MVIFATKAKACLALGRESNLMFYAQSTITVISGRERNRQRQTDRDTERDRHIGTERGTDRQTDTERWRETERERYHRQTD